MPKPQKFKGFFVHENPVISSSVRRLDIDNLPPLQEVPDGPQIVLKGVAEGQIYLSWDFRGLEETPRHIDLLNAQNAVVERVFTMTSHGYRFIPVNTLSSLIAVTSTSQRVAAETQSPRTRNADTDRTSSSWRY